MSTDVQDIRYGHERLIEDSLPLLGHPAHVVVGALTTTDKTDLTAQEAKDLIDAFLAREIA